ncbi:tRNA pseudouridine(55) synthase TruB [Candidatus Roizmanbacteria bacterium RIFCSPLOWO2_02_FULL_43_10]|uniref:tRNA pseudouridine synthase B n=1 Tax=Candidatus Roizmanbacteria bacterium RIFCSPLOWO2_02_FULL_43_10 TaxID=1802078 RepID=A0A1F7JT72_9BACT|nr:MAG: tRNA pseudouridine(55) synthase TruB [Candidatus Roizmanbacteria bacterium RIFCSPLOWO2_02_FULL_43_10]
MKKGIIAVYKPKGISSYDVIRKLKQTFPGEKIGHGGTLDPLAEGVLVVGIGQDATRQLGEVLKGTQKEYEVIIKLGEISETDDSEGPIHTGSDIKPSLSRVTDVLQQFMGEILQTPPQYSAVKVHGKPAYLRMRRGEKVVLEPRRVEILTIDVQSYQYPFLTLRIVCGSGVYIRSLARDIGSALKTGAYVYELKRTRVGDFTEEGSSII